VKVDRDKERERRKREWKRRRNRRDVITVRAVHLPRWLAVETRRDVTRRRRRTSAIMAATKLRTTVYLTRPFRVQRNIFGVSPGRRRLLVAIGVTDQSRTIGLTDRFSRQVREDVASFESSKENRSAPRTTWSLRLKNWRGR